MVFRFLKNKLAGRARQPAIPDGVRAYVIGDIHGRADLLENLAAQIAADLPGFTNDAVTIFLGDYIDRGPHSFEVVERLCHRDFPTNIITIRGNHEQTMLDALDRDQVFDAWRKYGGLETLVSYGVDVTDVMRGQSYGRARAGLNERVPDDHRAFLKTLRMTYELGDYFFCHAGVRPSVPLSQQSDNDLLWIRSEFLDSEKIFEKMIVHGHSPVDSFEMRPNRINLDTGAYATGRLTCLVLEGTSTRILTT